MHPSAQAAVQSSHLSVHLAPGDKGLCGDWLSSWLSSEDIANRYLRWDSGRATKHYIYVNTYIYIYICIYIYIHVKHLHMSM